VSRSKIAGISIGIAITIAIVAMVIFTNIDDMFSETISDVEVSNPFQTYEINTKEEYVCSLKDTNSLAGIFDELTSSPENFEQKYPNVVREVREYANSGQLERDFTITNGRMPPRLIEIMLPMFMNELSINPSLKSWVLDVFNSKIPQSEIRELENTFC